ncbi:alpha-D-ribose 1-methylphosphonate 5-triphosphate diphosphatase [Methylovirgula sp. 4M-Z18]|uniref:alpha-D-ribose 1-methylphosphonate 5-triphosphate diphosphatase n=1 Tax=Methylovirgula sp. 4M-Z18 TaxID=2293567 RepID=UPI000E2FE065|nr:alpha-D-ribose 1-methylphosphonate 5-triphosphate diphosphatase [Methylovirgula sp. 4M-Z18]RFB81254.1 alpha-D-ribose 1-methylphosphonate 5-triphosphate diphosphatase [Methylovirgula sp. 4M-Z18]
MTTILTNAQLVLEDEVRTGTIVFDKAGIQAVDTGLSSLPQAQDVGGDYVTPGIVEMHTDNMEKHFVPRPGVFWPDGLAAALAHDAQMAAAGVTTVYDSICIGSVFGQKDYRRDIFRHVIDAVEKGVAVQAFRIDHKIHLRCELSGDELLSDVEPYVNNDLVRLLSLMDHTPGQRQWRNLDDLKRFYVGGGEKTVAEYEENVALHTAVGAENHRKNLPLLLALFEGRDLAIATHDDTTEEDVAEGVACGAVISEFPTTVEAATAAKAAGLATIAGAPNVVRGGSHSGGVSAAELATLGVLDGLSSDYVPASLLQAVLTLHNAYGLPFTKAMGMVTRNVADMVGLRDRGHLKPGLRADILRFRALGSTPVVANVWSNGTLAF